MSEVPAESAFQPTLRAMAALLVAAAVLFPLWSTDIPPLLDYHNHLARQYILAELPTSPYLQTFYAANWKASPYLAIDVIVQALAHLMPIDVAGKAFLTLLLSLLALAPLALSWALFGRTSPVAWLGLLLIHNMTLRYGFVSYLFGVGFALCLLALWIRMREGPPQIRMLVFPLLGTLLFFSHLIAFAIYGLTVAAFELGSHIAACRARPPHAFLQLSTVQWTNALSLTLQCGIPLSLFLLFGPSTESVGTNFHGGIERKLDLLLHAFSYLMPPYNWTLDRALASLLPVTIVVLLLLRKLEIARSMLWPLGALLAAYFVMPMQLFSGWGADHRLLPALGLMLVGSLRLRTEPSRMAVGVAGLVALLLVARVTAITIEWRKGEQTYSEYLQAFEILTNGAKVFYAFGHAGEQRISTLPEYHMPTLALMRRHVYLPHLFSNDAGVVPLQYKPEVVNLQTLSRGPVLTNGRAPDWPAILSRFDYFLLIDEQYFSAPPPAELFPVFQGKKVRVYKAPNGSQGAG